MNGFELLIALLFCAVIIAIIWGEQNNKNRLSKMMRHNIESYNYMDRNGRLLVNERH